MGWAGRELRSTIDESGKLVLSIQNVEQDDPGDDEIIVRVEATPINPSDIGLLLGPPDVSNIAVSGSSAEPELTLKVP